MDGADDTDEGLCLRVQAGDREAASVLVIRYKPLVARQVRGMRIPTRVDFDDLIQVGRIALYRAAQKWEPGRKARYKTLAFVCVRHDLQKYLRSTVKQIRESLDCDEDVKAEMKPLDMLPDRDREPVEIPGLDDLDGTSRAVLTLTFGLEGGGPLGAGLVAMRLGLTPNQVNAIVQESLDKLRRVTLG